MIATRFAGQPTLAADSGLCAAVYWLFEAECLSNDTFNAMVARIRVYLDGAGWAYTTDRVVFEYSSRRYLYAADFSDEARDARSLAALWLALDAEAEETK